MKVQNSTGKLAGLDAPKIDKVDIKGGGVKQNDTAKSEAIASATKVDLSQRAQDLKKIKDIAMTPPQVDSEKVAKLQKMIDEGKYKVDAKAVADRMVDEHLLFDE